MAGHSHGSMGNQCLEMDTLQKSTSEIDNISTRKGIEFLGAADPFDVVQLVLELQAERMHTEEAINARDAVVHRLADAYESIHQKTVAIELLRQEVSGGIAPISKSSPFVDPIEMGMKEEIVNLEKVNKSLLDEIRVLKESATNVMKSPDPPPCYEERMLRDSMGHPRARPHSQPLQPELHSSFSTTTNSQISSQDSWTNFSSRSPTEGSIIKPPNVEFADYRVLSGAPFSDEPADMVKARNAILATLPLPEEVPDDTLNPLSIPAPFTLQEFISNLSEPLRSSLVHYRLFYAPTTLWCPEREEHGYFYTPIFKCSTNPRVITAHRWSPVDVISRMSKPTECFFNKDGIWYYAGVYRAFRLDDLTTKEWAELPAETIQPIVRDTISGRKNTSPQNIYEVSQLYAAGALKVACVGLQCVGFNNAMYKALLDQASAFSQSKWKGAVAAAGFAPAVTGLGTGSAWNANASGTNDIISGLRAMSLVHQNTEATENMPIGAICDRGSR